MIIARRLAVAALLATLLAPRIAAAEPSTDPEPAERGATTTCWYGWQTLLVDGGVIGASLATQNSLVFLGGYTLGAPIVHWAHGNVLRGVGSLSVRLAAPLIAGLGYAEANQPRPRTGHEPEEALSFAIVAGGLAAIAFDAAFLARSERTIANPPPAAWKVEPRLSASQKGAYAGIGGIF